MELSRCMAPEEAPPMVNTTEGSMKTQRARKWVRCGSQHRYIQEEWSRGDGGQWEVGGKSEEGRVHQGSARRADKAPRGTASGGGVGRDPISFLRLPPPTSHPTSPPQCVAVLTRRTSRFLISVRRHVFMCCGVDPTHGTSTDLEWASVRSKMRLR